MNKEKEVEVVDSKEAESYGESGRSDNSKQDKGKSKWKNDDKDKIEWKGAAHIEEVLDLTKEEEILTLEVVFVVIDSNVAKKGIDLLNVDLLKVGKIIEML